MKALFYPKIRAIIKVFSILFLLTILQPKTAFGDTTCTFSQVADTFSIQADCNFSNTDGVDYGSGNSNTAKLKIPTGKTLTILSGTVAVGSLDLTAGGSIVIANDAQIKLNTPLWLTDTDNDNYADNFTQYAQVTAPSNGKRKNQIVSLTNADCNPSDNTKWHYLTGYSDNDSDSYGLGSSTQICSGDSLPSGYANNNTDCNDGSNLVYISHSLCYKDSDIDGYTTGSAANSTCLNASNCNSATKASDSSQGAAVTSYTAGQLKDSANGSDCDDNNAAKWRNRYQDSDSDAYCTSSTPSCVGNDAGYRDSCTSYTDCNDGSNLVYISHSLCYKDSDIDGYTTGSAANSTCLNASNCNSATKASDSSQGAAVTSYTAGQLKDSANGSDCDDNNAAKWRNRYQDSDSDAYCTSSTPSCVGNDAGYRDSCTSYTDCNDSNANTWRWRYSDADSDGHCPNTTTYCVGNDAGYRDSCTSYNDCGPSTNTAYPNSTTCSTNYFNHRDGGTSYDYNCDSSMSKCSTIYYIAQTCGYYKCQYSAGQCKKILDSSAGFLCNLDLKAACGSSGYSQGTAKYNCQVCSGSSPSNCKCIDNGLQVGYEYGPTGTQACQ